MSSRLDGFYIWKNKDATFKHMWITDGTEPTVSTWLQILREIHEAGGLLYFFGKHELQVFKPVIIDQDESWDTVGEVEHWADNIEEVNALVPSEFIMAKLLIDN